MKIRLLLAEIWPKMSQKADLGSNFLKISGGRPPDPPNLIVILPTRTQLFYFYGMWGRGAIILFDYLVPDIRPPPPPSSPSDHVFSVGSENILRASMP